jgi:cytidine deaminase
VTTAPSADSLIDSARQAATRAYAPYSSFPVGAAVVDGEGRVFLGCNVENASFGLTICAERSAIVGALAAGAVRPFRAIAVTCPKADPTMGVSGRSPCGACRQVISEHLLADAPVYIDGASEHLTVADLLPYGFHLRGPIAGSPGGA